MERIPQDYLGGNLSSKSTTELKELLHRQENLLKRVKFLETLPDGGKKVHDFAEKLNKLINERSDSENNLSCYSQKQAVISPVLKDNRSQARDKTVPDVLDSQARHKTVSGVSDSCQRNKRPVSRFKKQGNNASTVGGSNVKEYKKFGSLVEEEAKHVDSNLTCEMIGIASQGESPASSVVRDQVSLSALETALEDMDISSERQADNYLLDFIERSNCNKKREPLKLNRDIKISDINDLPNEFRPPASITKKTTGNNKSLFTEESAVCPPKYKFAIAKEMPLPESMQLQEEQSKRREEYQAVYAAEKLAEKLNIRMDTFNPEVNDANYREPLTIDSDDDLEGVD